MALNFLLKHPNSSTTKAKTKKAPKAKAAPKKVATGKVAKKPKNPANKKAAAKKSPAKVQIENLGKKLQINDYKFSQKVQRSLNRSRQRQRNLPRVQWLNELILKKQVKV